MSTESPVSITILPTYRCNASCEQCCFESNPQLTTRLSLEDMIGIIDQAKSEFPSLRAVVFSGGECTLLKDDLYDAIARVTSHGLMSRIVTNAGWGKTKRTTSGVVNRLRDAGLTEANISTGLDHQRWVPLASVINAAEGLVDGGIRTLITVERDTHESACRKDLLEDSRIKALLGSPSAHFSVVTNSWMPFNTSYVERTANISGRLEQEAGCTQLFKNLVFNPYKEVSACCGLTFEHIPELKLGKIDSGQSFKGMYDSQFNDFLKIWIHIDGPKKIAEELLGERGLELIGNSVHICQSCVLLHKSEELVQAMKDRYLEFVPRVMSKFHTKQLLSRVSVI